MSTDRQRLQDAIRRIAKSDPDLSALIGDSKNKGGQASSSGIGVSDAERDNLCCDGTEGAGANAGSDQRDPDSDTQRGLDSDDPADLGSGPGSLTGITDCATGADICFDGSDWLPPDGWDGPLDPPEAEGWEEGFFWQRAWGSPSSHGPNITYHSTPPSVCDFVGCEPFLSQCSSNTNYFIQVCDDGVYVASRYKLACADHLSNEDAQAACVDETPLLTEWPEDGCNNLISRDGKIVGSKFDPENDGSYSAPRDELEVCDSSGNRILLRGSPTGGWKSIKSLSGDIDPDTGNGYLYRPNGQRVRQISPSEFRDDTV